MSLNSGVLVVDAQLNMQSNDIYLILNNTMAGEHRYQHTQTLLMQRQVKTFCGLRMSCLTPHEIVKKRHVRFRATKFRNHILADMN